MYAIKKGRYYVKAAQGQKTPYTPDASKAALYPTYEDAKKNACGNEQVVQIRAK
ncbi:MAG: hypothetical protein WC714_28895 [Candidatus Obscuribacterales bacterium]|jgi:hypothetical protein